MKDGLDINSLSEIMIVFNQHLMPTVLCLWGESEYIHKCGKVPFYSILQKYLPKYIIRKSSPSNGYQNVDSSHDDYVRESINQYDVFLLNPSWRVIPSILFIEGPSFLWGILIDGDILDTYGDYDWRFVPLK